MRQKDILSMIRGDLTRNKKKKKSLDDFLVGDDEFEDYMPKKKNNQNEEPVDELDKTVGKMHGSDKVSKPNVKMLKFDDLHRSSPKEQIHTLKREYLSLYDKLEEISEELVDEKKSKSELQIKLEQVKKEIAALKLFVRAIIDFFPDAYDLKITLDTSDWKLENIKEEALQKANNLLTAAKNNQQTNELELQKMEAQKNMIISELEKTRERVVRSEKEKYELHVEYKKVVAEFEKYKSEAAHAITSKPETSPVLSDEPEEELNDLLIVPTNEKDEETVITPPIKEEEPSPPVPVEKPVHTEKSEPVPTKEVTTTVHTKPEPENKPAAEPEKPIVQPPTFKEPEFPSIEEFQIPVFTDITELEVITKQPVETPDYIYLDVDQYLKKISDAQKHLVKMIGAKGIERNVILKKEIEEDEEAKKYFYSNGKYSNNDVNNAVKGLRDFQLMESTNLKLGSKGGYDFMVYKLTEKGCAVYYKLTNELPVESNIEQVLRDHKTLEHGYLIKELATEFHEMGYTVFEDREHCTYHLDGGKRKVFDLVIEKDGVKKHIEVERGTHNEVDFFNMVDKIYCVTQDIYFVAPNSDVLLKQTKGKVFKWIAERLGGFDAAKGKVRFHFSTFEKIKKKQKKIWEDYEL